MKFIGQYIQDFIARFRSDVYLENIDSGTIASGGSLGLDSNNKIVKASASAAPDADATTKGIVELATTAETTTGTDATRAVTPDGLKDGFQGSTNIVAVGTITSGAWRGIAIDQTYLVGQSGINTGDQTTVSGNAGTATKLETTRALQVTLSETDSANFDGSAAVTDIGVTGTLAVGNGGTGLTSISTLLNSNVTSVSGNAGTATALATARDINGVSFDGTGDITVTAAGSTLSDTVTVAKGGTGATTLTDNAVLTGTGTSAITAESTLSYTSETLTIGADDSGEAIITRLAHGDEAGGSLSVKGGDAGGSTRLGGNLNLYGGASRGAPAGGSIKFFSTPGGTETGSNLGTHVEIAALNSGGNLQIDGGLTVGSTSFVDSSGVIQVAGQTNITGIGTITTGVWNGTTIATANTAAKVTSVIAGDGIDVDSTTGDVTVTAETASDTNPGVVELATTGEADTGTDTARAVTPAGLKSHVDTKFAYQYIGFTGNVTANTSGNSYWEYPTANGISNHTWTQIVKNTTGGVNNRDTTTVGDEVGIDRLNQGSAGIRIPYAGTIVGFTGGGRNASGDRVYYAGLFVGTPDWGTTNDINAELVAVATADNNSGSYLSRPSKLEDLSRSYSIAAGDVIYPAFKGSGTNADIIQANITIVIKTPLV